MSAAGPDTTGTAGLGYAGDLTPQQAHDLLASDPAAVLVDVRTQAEWAFVGVPDLSGLGRELITIEWTRFPGGARNEAFLEELQRAGVSAGTPVAFLCRSGARSAAAAIAATQAGLGPAYNISDGFEGGHDGATHRGQVAGWKASGLPWTQP